MTAPRDMFRPIGEEGLGVVEAEATIRSLVEAAEGIRRNKYGVEVLVPDAAGARLLGYARVSTDDQNLALQFDALKASGVSKIYWDQMSGAKRGRPALEGCLQDLRAGDTLVIWRLDRLGRSLLHLVELVDGFGRKGINLRVIMSGMDTRTPEGRMIFGMMATFAEYERELIRERIIAGLAAARAAGRPVGGKTARMVSDGQEALALRLVANGATMQKVSELLHIPLRTMWRREGFREASKAGRSKRTVKADVLGKKQAWAREKDKELRVVNAAYGKGEIDREGWRREVERIEEKYSRHRRVAVDDLLPETSRAGRWKRVRVATGDKSS